MAVSTATPTPTSAAGTSPMTGFRYAPVRNPVNAEERIIPSMPMFTTPDRSFITPQSAP